MISNYPGSKNASGIIPFLINNIPFHTRYFELCAGSAKLFQFKKRATANFLNDIDEDTAFGLYDLPGNFPLNVQWNYFLETWDIRPGDTVTTMYDQMKYLVYFPWLLDDFIYLDPPYPFDSRRSDRKIYRHEMTDSDHVQLLTAAQALGVNIMISTRANDLYTDMLKGWRCKSFNTVDRGGAAVELIYMNYPEPELLHQYDYLGDGRTERQQIKRKRESFYEKVQDLDKYQRHALIQEMILTDRSAVQHFLTTLDGK